MSLKTAHTIKTPTTCSFFTLTLSVIEVTELSPTRLSTRGERVTGTQGCLYVTGRELILESCYPVYVTHLPVQGG